MKGIPVFNFTVQKQSQSALDISIDGDIVDAQTEQVYKDWFGDETSTSFKGFRDQCDKAINDGVTTINGTINSGGGLISEAMAMHDYLVDIQSSKNIAVNLVGTGIVASAATYILMASKNSALTKNSFFMVHDVSGGASGTVTEMEQAAATMRKFNNTVRDFYCQKTGLPQKDISTMMQNETWLSADEAKQKGFVTSVKEPQNFTNKIDPAKWMFNNTAVLAAYNSFTNKTPEMDITKITSAIEAGFQNMLAKMGIKNEGDNTTQALAELASGITNAIKDSEKSQEELITNKVNEAVTIAISNLSKEVPESVKNLISESLKNSATAEDLKKVSEELETTKQSIANRTAGSSIEKASNSTGSKFDHPGIEIGE